MKTPREVLFARHHTAQTKLDTLRQEVLADLPGKHAAVPADSGARPAVRWSFREFLRPFRWHLTGLSATWLLVAILNSEPTTATRPAFTSQGTPPPRQLLMAFREHRRQLWELLQPPVVPALAVPHAFAPQRQSDSTLSPVIA